MYDTSLTRQALPSKRYCYLLGVALSVFISNNGFIIENILRTDRCKNWWDLLWDFPLSYKGIELYID